MNQVANIQEIPLKDLTVSPLNVRKTSSDKEIAELAQSIQSKGLIQNLTAFTSKGGKKYEVVAGGRRLQALQLLAKNKVIDQGTYTVRVNLIEKSDATDISLTENAMRADLHPADQFEAFKKLVDDGTSIEDVAASFSVTPSVVSRRLRMASAAPEVIEAFKSGDIELDKVMALCTTDDHKIQKSFLKKTWWGANSIRNEINREVNGVDAEDRLVKFIGLDVYQAAGGQIIEDLFASEFDDGSGMTLTNTGLVQDLAEEKLTELTSSAYKKSKLEWHQPDIKNTYLAYGEYEKFSAKDAKQIQGKYLGVVGVIAKDGSPEIIKYVAKRSDVNKVRKLLNGGGEGPSNVDVAVKPLLSSDATSKITQVRTKALQCAIAANADKAIKMLVCQMIKATYDGRADDCIGLRISSALIFTEVDSLESLQDQQFKACGLDALMDDGEPKENLSELVDQLKTPQLIQILAFLTAAMVDVTQGAYGLHTATHERFTELGNKFKLNMADHFKPTADNYFNHMPKSALIEFLGDSGLESKKKGLLATIAEDRVEANWNKGSKYVPEILRIDQDGAANDVAWPFPEKAE